MTAVRDDADDARSVLDTEDDAVAEAILSLAAMPSLDYQRVRLTKAKELGLRAAVLDAAVRAARLAAGDEQQKASQRDELVSIGLEAELWQDETGRGFATVEVDHHRESHPLRSEAFRRWLLRTYGDRHLVPAPDGGSRPAVPGSQAQKEAIDALDAYAARGPVEVWFVRLGWTDTAVYLDLGTSTWAAVEVTAGCWQIVPRPAVRFVRPSGLRPLPLPARSRSGLRELSRILGLKRGASRLVIGWLLGCFMPRGPYPVLSLSGEQGSGKTTVTRMLRRLVDPNAAETRSRPRDERDLLIAARNAWVVAFENLSRLDQELSDGMCRVATGAGFGTRTLFTDLDETLVAVCRPQIINGIPDLATAADLLDRSITVTLPPRRDGGLEYERELWQRFDEAAPRILGTLLDAVATALRRLHEVELEHRPRMLDFTRWVEAAAPALGWKPGKFLTAYIENRRGAAQLALEADPLASLITALMKETRHWQGTADALLGRLRALADEGDRRTLPATAHHLSNRVRRLSPSLRRVGLKVTFDRDKHARTIQIENAPPEASPASPASPRRPVGLNGAVQPARGDAGDANDAEFARRSEGSASACPPAYDEVTL